MSNLLAAIRTRQAQVSQVRTTVVGTMESAPARFSALELHVEASGSAEELERIVEIADRSCIMLNTLRGTLDLAVHTRALLPGRPQVPSA